MPLRLERRKGSPNWYIRGAVRGTRVFETTGTDDRGLAEALRIKREGEILHRSVFGAGATVTFAEAALSYIEAGGETRFLGRYDETSKTWTLLIGHFYSTPVGAIGQHEIDLAAEALYPGCTAATKKRQMYVPLAAVLHHAARKGWRDTPRFVHPKVARTETKWSTPERLQTLLPHCYPKLRRLVIFLVYTGARIGECLRLDWERDMRLSERTAILRRTKNGKGRAVHLPDPVLIALAAVPEKERKGQVFQWHARHAVYGPLKRACKKAGVEYLPPHQQGRHTYATWQRTYGGLDLRGLMEAGGWDSIQSVVRYAHVTPGEAARAADKLPIVQSESIHNPRERKSPVKLKCKRI